MHHIIREILDGYDSQASSFYEFSVGQNLRANQTHVDGDDHESLAEIIAFSLCENFQPEDGSGWGTYYGPALILPKPDGTVIESPSISKITKEMVAHWKRRMTDSKHPVMRRRYASLVWDLHKRIAGNSPGKECAEITIDSTIEMAATKAHPEDTSVFEKLEQAISIARSIKDIPRQESCKIALINFEEDVARDEYPGLWGYALELLVIGNLCPITEAEKTEIIQSMESRLARLLLADNDRFDPWSIQSAALALANYYHKERDDQMVDKLLANIDESFEKILPSGQPLQKTTWLKMLHEMYTDFGRKEDSERIRLRVEQTSLEIPDSLKTVSTSIDLKQDEIDKYVKSMTADNLESSLIRMIVRFLPDRNETEKSLHELSRLAPLSFLLTAQILDDSGRNVANVGPLHEDLEGHVVRKIYQDMVSSSFFLRLIIENLTEKFGFSHLDVIDHLKGSPLFSSSNQIPTIEHAIKSYFAGDFTSFCHIITPQFEAALRNILEISGQTTLKPARTGGYFTKLLDEILREPKINEALGSNVVLYYKVLLTDQRGWNFRNDISHGLCSPQDFSQIVSDRLFHAFLILGSVRFKDEPPPSP